MSGWFFQLNEFPKNFPKFFKVTPVGLWKNYHPFLRCYKKSKPWFSNRSIGGNRSPRNPCFSCSNPTTDYLIQQEKDRVSGDVPESGSWTYECCASLAGRYCYNRPRTASRCFPKGVARGLSVYRRPVYWVACDRTKKVSPVAATSEIPLPGSSPRPSDGCLILPVRPGRPCPVPGTSAQVITRPWMCSVNGLSNWSESLCRFCECLPL